MRRFLAVCVPWLALAAGAADGTRPDVRVVGGERPSALEALDSLPPHSALAVTPDGTSLVAALSGGNGGRSSTLVWRGGGTAVADRPVEIDGVVRDLLAPDATTVLILASRERKRGPDETALWSYTRGEKRPRLRVGLPPSASDLALDAATGTLYVAAIDEIRSFSWPDLRSGSLFPVAGDNRAVAPLGAHRLAVGQSDGLVLVDLGDRPGREAMPVRERLEVPGGVTTLAVSADAERLEALVSGRARRVRLDPLRLDTGVAADVLIAAAPASGTVAGRLPAPAAPAPRIVAPEPTAAAPEGPPERAPDPSPDLQLEREAEPAPADPPPPREAEPLDATPPAPAQVFGRVTIPAELDVGGTVFVTLHGPDNLVRERLRVAVDADGNFRAEGLEPGRYRVQLAGDGTRLPVSDPRFHLVTIGEDAAPQRIDFRVRRVL